MRRLTLLAAFLPVSFTAVAYADKERLDQGDEAPNFAAKTLNPDVAKTKVFTLDSVVGAEATDKKKAVVTSFVSASCEPCQKELKFLQALYTTYKDKGLLVVGVATDKEETDTKRMADATAALDFPVINDRFNIVAQRYFVNKPPYMYIIDESGKVAKMTQAYDDIGNKATLDEVRKNLGIPVSEQVPEALSSFIVGPKPAEPPPPEPVAAAIPKTDEPAAAPAVAEPIKKTTKKEKKEKPAKEPVAAAGPKKVVGKPPPKAGPPPPPTKGPKRVGRKP